jgi:hypothetical protein
MKKKKVLARLLNHWLVLFLIAGLAVVTACQDRTAMRNFVLPEGDVADGKQAYKDLYCNDCHSIGDIGWNGSEEAGDVHIPLGGEVTRIKSYGELLTSVINPSHRISKKYKKDQEVTLPGDQSKMELYNYNEVMTVQELVDIVMFLQSEYELIVPENTYPYY